MKKTILSLMLMIVTCIAFGKNADSLIKKYSTMEGARFQEIPKPQELAGIDKDLSKRIKKLEYIQVRLDEQQRKELKKEIMEIKNYRTFYATQNNIKNMRNKDWSIISAVEYHGKEEKGIIEDAIMLVELKDNGGDISYIIHVTGKLNVKELYNSLTISTAVRN